MLRERVLAALGAHDEGHLTLLFHPFLTTGDAVAALADVLERAAELECLRMDEAAAALAGGAGPSARRTSWDD